jgi:FtsP/CotA-like multicopper oxidase with cupredoxin domain
MVVLIALAVISLGVFGCGRKATALNGTWRIDTDKQIAALKDQDAYKKLPAPAKSSIEDRMKKGFESTTFTFADGKLTAKAGEGRSQEADYKVTKTEGDKWTLDTTDKNKKTETVTVDWHGDDNIVLTPPAGNGPMQLQFFLTRQK